MAGAVYFVFVIRFANMGLLVVLRYNFSLKSVLGCARERELCMSNLINITRCVGAPTFQRMAGVRGENGRKCRGSGGFLLLFFVFPCSMVLCFFILLSLVVPS